MNPKPTREEVAAGMLVDRKRRVLNLGHPPEGSVSEGEWQAYYTFIPHLAGFWSRTRHGIWASASTGSEWYDADNGERELHVIPTELELLLDAENVYSCVSGGGYQLIPGRNRYVKPADVDQRWRFPADPEHPLRVSTQAYAEKWFAQRSDIKRVLAALEDL